MNDKIRQLWDLIETEGIRIKYSSIKQVPEEMDGLYIYRPDTGPIVILDKSLHPGSREYNCTLAHEVGHHFTSVKTNTFYSYKKYRDLIEKDREERRAMIWATDYLIPDWELSHATQTLRLRSLHDLEDHFEVTHEFLLHKILIVKQRLWNRGIYIKSRGVLGLDLVACGL